MAGVTQWLNVTVLTPPPSAGHWRNWTAWTIVARHRCGGAERGGRRTGAPRRGAARQARSGRGGGEGPGAFRPQSRANQTLQMLFSLNVLICLIYWSRLLFMFCLHRRTNSPKHSKPSGTASPEERRSHRSRSGSQHRSHKKKKKSKRWVRLSRDFTGLTHQPAGVCGSGAWWCIFSFYSLFCSSTSCSSFLPSTSPLSSSTFISSSFFLLYLHHLLLPFQPHLNPYHLFLLL